MSKMRLLQAVVLLVSILGVDCKPSLVETSENFGDFTYYYQEDPGINLKNLRGERDSFQFHTSSKWGKVILIYLDEMKIASYGYKESKYQKNMYKEWKNYIFDAPTNRNSLATDLQMAKFTLVDDDDSVIYFEICGRYLNETILYHETGTYYEDQLTEFGPREIEKRKLFLLGNWHDCKALPWYATKISLSYDVGFWNIQSWWKVVALGGILWGNFGNYHSLDLVNGFSNILVLWQQIYTFCWFDPKIFWLTGAFGLAVKYAWYQIDSDENLGSEAASGFYWRELIYSNVSLAHLCICQIWLVFWVGNQDLIVCSVVAVALGVLYLNLEVLSTFRSAVVKFFRI